VRQSEERSEEQSDSKSNVLLTCITKNLLLVASLIAGFTRVPTSSVLGAMFWSAVE